MLILSSETDAVEVVLAGARTTNDCPITAYYRDITTTTFVPGRSLLNTNGTTPVDAVTGPASSTQRVVDFLSVYNEDTASVTATLRFSDDGTTYTIATVTLGVGERLEYSNDRGVRVYSNNGAEKIASVAGSNPAASGIQQVVLGSDVTNNNATLNTIADVTGLSFAVVTGTYWFRFVIDYTSAATTTGSRWSISGPTTSRLVYESRYTLTATTQTLNILTAYNSPAASNASSLTAGNVATIEGYATFTAPGTLTARFASEVANSAIVAKAGSQVQYVKVL